MHNVYTLCGTISRRSPHGGRGLKFVYKSHRVTRCDGRSPHGGRGLKYLSAHNRSLRNRSLPAWGAWIEIERIYNVENMLASRSPHGGRGLKSQLATYNLRYPRVAPRMGGVD